MALTPQEREEPDRSSDGAYRKFPWVTWIAITLGVGMTVIGFILLLWGFAWQTDVGEVQNINDNGFKGGPALIPLGGAMLVIGILWILQGYRGFKKDQTGEDMQICRNCGKMIESDLNFCYYCNKTFEEVEKGEQVRTPKRSKMTDDEDEKGTKKKARPFSPAEK